VLKDIVHHATEIDFQQGKNLIFEAISRSEVMPQASANKSMSHQNSERTLKSNDSPPNFMSSEDNEGSLDQLDVIEVGSMDQCDDSVG